MLSKTLQEPKATSEASGSHGLRGYWRRLSPFVMNQPIAFLTTPPQACDSRRSALRPQGHGFFARGRKLLRPLASRPVFAALWLASLIAGSFVLTRYETTPGADTPAPAQWPSGVSIRRDLNLPTLVMFLHPYCPCSSASVGELALIMARCQGRVESVVVIAVAEGLNNPKKGDLERAAELIPGVTVLRDQGGVAARRFHAATSGRTVLYDKNGSLMFAGGITSARAHSGDNVGRDAIVALIAGKESLVRTTPAFGCPIFSLKDGPSAAKCPTDSTHLVSLSK